MKKIVVIGPESTGKSWLCSQLATHYNTRWVPEYAREFLLSNGNNYTYADLLHIAKGQQALEEQYIAKHSSFTTHHSSFTASPLIIDTNQYVMKVWCEVVFNNCHTWILQQAAKQQYDLYLLCNTDLPWVQDGLREYPDLAIRERLFFMYKDLLINDGTPWAIVSGTGENRLSIAVSAIDKILTSHQ